jgi:hypothetical protein
MTRLGKFVFSILAILIIGGAWYAFSSKTSTPETPVQKTEVATPKPFTIDGTPITLVNGKFEMESAPGSASKIETDYFGNEVKGDFNGDGTEDTAYLVTQSGGGSGIFFYLVTSLGGPAQLLGDRIAPQTTEWRDGKIIVNYADRAAGEPMAADPSVGVSKYFVVKNGELVESK